MNLNINYLPNSTGIDIAQGLADELSYISTREVKIAGLDYLEISIKDEDSNNKRTLNTVSSIINSLDSENMSKILSLNLAECLCYSAHT